MAVRPAAPWVRTRLRAAPLQALSLAVLVLVTAFLAGALPRAVEGAEAEGLRHALAEAGQPTARSRYWPTPRRRTTPSPYGRRRRVRRRCARSAPGSTHSSRRPWPPPRSAARAACSSPSRCPPRTRACPGRTGSRRVSSSPPRTASSTTPGWWLAPGPGARGSAPPTGAPRPSSPAPPRRPCG
ncbi:hypothetical protein ACFQVA_12180 [Actinomadura keratinilytica]